MFQGGTWIFRSWGTWILRSGRTWILRSGEEHGSCAVGDHGSCASCRILSKWVNMDLAQWGGGPGGGSLCKFQMKFAQRGGTTRLLYNGGGVKGGGSLCKNQNAIQWCANFKWNLRSGGGSRGGGALCNMHVFDASLLFFPFRAKLAKLSF